MFDDIFQGFEWIIMFIIVLLLFGPSKLPQLARSLGQAIWEFKKASQGLLEESRERDTASPGSDREKVIRLLAERLGVTSEVEERERLIVEVTSGNDGRQGEGKANVQRHLSG